MSLTLGNRLGQYEILAPIGAGGMGEVYRARDTKLGRDVALKVLPEAFARDADRMARFEREAKVLASLNHPNIAQIYGVEQGALVIELVEGDTLKGPLPIETALDYAGQIAEALESAHEKGIVHRDLKPANIKITSQGVVKVLDFGLAKAADEYTASGDPQASPTFTMSPTRAGMILGTAAYMSPEQARGKSVDKRADIWSFGVVLYEMLTGKQAFTGETITDLLAAVVKEEPDLDRVPAQARRLLHACLKKDPRQRLQAIGDWRLLLDDVPHAAPARKTIPPWTIAAVLLLALATLAYFRRPAEQPRVLKFSVLPPENATLPAGSLPTVSPDGRRLALVAAVDGKTTVWVRDLDSLAARQLPGTEGARRPFWSPDSHLIGFFAGGKLKKVDVAGGPSLTLCDAQDNDSTSGTWGKSDVIVFGPIARNLLRVSATGGIATLVSAPNNMSETDQRWPWFLPDGRHFLYTTSSVDSEKSGVYIADLDSKNRRQVLVTNANAIYAMPGYLLFMREETLMAQPFDAGKGGTSSQPVPIAEHVDYLAASRIGQFSSSQNGVLVYISGGGGKGQLTWYDRSGKITGTVGTPLLAGGTMGAPSISPDGSKVVAVRQDPQTVRSDLWLDDLARGTESRLTFGPGNRFFPVWSPDGSRIAFSSNRDGFVNLYQKFTSASAEDEALDKAVSRFKRPTDWSRDGRYIIEETLLPTGKQAVWLLPLFGDRKPFPYLQTDFNEYHARLSPNGHWLAYVSDETRRDEIYVQTFPKLGSKWQISSHGGSLPVWSRDGKELFFIDADRKMMVAEVKNDMVKDDSRFQAGVPKPLFGTRLIAGDVWFDVSKDGRFLIPTQVEGAVSAPITVVVNWTAGLKK